MSQNHFDSMLNEVVEILSSDTIDWPEELSHSDRILLVEKLIAYYESKEQYEKCKPLKKLLDSLFTKDF